MKFLFSFAAVFFAGLSLAQQPQFLTKTFVEFTKSSTNIQIASTKSGVVSIVCDQDELPGAKRAVADVRRDLGAVIQQPINPGDVWGGKSPTAGKPAVIIGTIGYSRVIEHLIANGKLNVDGVKDKWESYVIQTIKNPLPGVPSAVVIAGSDKRGTIYGAYELSEQAGVSPWYWWADVPIKKHANVFVKAGRYVQKSPAVKYRGIFINDEAPALSNWVYKNFGEYKSKFYVKVFELLLRLRANYLWPAMWNNCFNEDDPLNPKLADEYGIVMGTSHVEPMGRADKEWNRLGFKPEQWNYLTFPQELEKFWADGVRRNKPYETINTIAMRGKIDTPMSEEDNIELLEKIVAAQRKIIAKEVNSDVTKVPQLWCLYKEVQNYYDKGMRVPDDVTLLWADDNWGNIRRLPTPDERKRSGGAGVYYHFDYVGGPRNYKWLNTSTIPRIWEQMHLAYESKADRIWIVNVGDIKPVEFPTEFFIRMGWEPNRYTPATLSTYTKNWVVREFGTKFADGISELLTKYAKYNARRKPELIDPSSFSLVNYREAETIVSDYNHLASLSTAIYSKLPADQKDAYFQLVHYPVLACANLNAMYVAAAKNKLYGAQTRASANAYFDLTNSLFAKDASLQKQFHTMNKGKWDHMMDQTHIGYTSWQQPDKNVMPSVSQYAINATPAMGLTIEGSTNWWPNVKTAPKLPLVSPYDLPRYFELYNRGKGLVNFAITSKDAWLRFSQTTGDLNSDQRIYVSADFLKIPVGVSQGSFDVIGTEGSKFSITVPIRRPADLGKGFKGHIESDGYVSIEAIHYSQKTGDTRAKFVDLPSIGRTDSGVTLFPVTSASLIPSVNRVSLQYPIFFFSKGEVKLNAYLSPTQHLKPGTGLKYAVSIDGQPPITVNMHDKYVYFTPTWENSVAQNANIVSTKLTIPSTGVHTLKIWAIDPGVVFQKFVIDTGGLRPSYLGPPESYRIQ